MRGEPADLNVERIHKVAAVNPVRGSESANRQSSLLLCVEVCMSLHCVVGSSRETNDSVSTDAFRLDGLPNSLTTIVQGLPWNLTVAQLVKEIR